ncbi:hypothetical protein T484DRAFT_1799927, partial [Baffinella frigidus]
FPLKLAIVTFFSMWLGFPVVWLAIVTFFFMWIGFPIVWVLSSRTGVNLLSEDAVQILHCIFDLIAKSVFGFALALQILHCIFDLIAKSVFGFALARFRSYYDKKMYEMVDALHLGE